MDEGESTDGQTDTDRGARTDEKAGTNDETSVGPNAGRGGDDRGTPSPAELVGGVLLAAVPITLAAVPAALVARLVPIDAMVAVPVAAGVALVGSYAVGPPLVERAISEMDPMESNGAERLRERVISAARSNGHAPPTVRVVQRSAVTIGVTTTREGTTLVVPSRLSELDDPAFEAMVLHALARADSRNARVTTGLLPAALLVEAVRLLASGLLSHRPSGEDDRPLAFGDDGVDGRSIPWIGYALSGTVLLVVVAPWWLLLAAGDRLLVGRGRVAADRAVASRGRADALADALEYARDASGHREWAPEIDRLAVVPMGEIESRRMRGGGRGGLRVRIARLRSKRPV